MRFSRRSIGVLLLVLAWMSMSNGFAQTSKPYTDPSTHLKGTQTVTSKTLGNGHTIETTELKISGDVIGYVEEIVTTSIEKDAAGNKLRETQTGSIADYTDKGGKKILQTNWTRKDIYDEAGGYVRTDDSSHINLRTGVAIDQHTESKHDAGGKWLSGHRKVTTRTPGEKPVVAEENWNGDTKSWEKVALPNPNLEPINSHPGHLASTATGGGHHAKHATGSHAAATHAKRTASLYLSGTIVSLEGCEGEFYKSFPTVGLTQTDNGVVTTKGGAFEFNGSAMAYDPYTGKLMADGNFQLTSSRSAGTSIEGTILPDNTISGTWHKVYDRHCSYTVKLVRGKGVSGSNVSVSGGGSWRLALSGSHQ